MSESKFTFTPPPEAPVFYPTIKEFEDPLLYLEKIRPFGVKTGICKIIPPKGWNPPFAVDVNTFRFTPRIQRLYELEAHSRIKLDFISKLYQFNRLHGMDKLRVPSINGKYLDLFWLHKHVQNAGGYEKVNAGKQWPQIAEKLGYSATKHGTTMKTNYDKLLLQYDLVMASRVTAKDKMGFSQPFERAEGKNEGEDMVDNVTPSKRAKSGDSDEGLNKSVRKELKNLQFYGAGPKAAIPLEDTHQNTRVKPQKTTPNNCYACRVCSFDNDESNLLICSTASCEACYHTFCLTPPLSSVPRYPWKCPDCVRDICSRPMELFGFPQSEKSYTLYEFGVRADSFKAQYFGQEPSSVPCSTVEEEFWRILQDYSTDVVVEYGADVHASDQGSGFPTELQLQRSPHLFPTPEQRRQALAYAQSPWNLNNLPVYGNSVLRFIRGNVDGMKVPWCYVGMAFSTFCWHIEDHWSCSINFNHWGEPKTWYGVACNDAEVFEKAMRKQAGELFDLSPDLLHHITTIMNPNLLQAEGVPIYRTDQHCGEFVVTFPRAYHAGFNQGFNFAEAVNVCPPAWLPTGRACVEHYAAMRRQCVFSNDELLLCLAEVIAGKREMRDCATYTDLAAAQYCAPSSSSSPPASGGDPAKQPISGVGDRTQFEPSDLRIIHDEFSLVVSREVERRRRLLPECAQSVRFPLAEELADDDERVCVVCQTTLFFSALACPCKTPEVLKRASAASSTNTPRLGTKRKGPMTARMVPPAPPSAPSCIDRVPQRSCMVCLEHADSICEKCSLSDCTLYYAYTLEDLEDTRSRLEARLVAYEDWRRDFGGLFLGSNDTKKPSTSSKEEDASIKKVDLETFEKQLKNARLFGYHTDLLYKRANAYCDNIKELLGVCVKAAQFILVEPTSPAAADDLDSSTAAPSQLDFQLKVPSDTPSASGAPKTPVHVMHYSIDLKNPREIDFTRLLEAVDIESSVGPILIDETTHPSIGVLRHLFRTRLPQWRLDANDVVTAVSSRSGGATLLFGLQQQTSTKAEHDSKSTKKEQPSALPLQKQLADLVASLQSEYPGWCPQMEEFKLVSLLEEVCRWLSACTERFLGVGVTASTPDTSLPTWCLSDLSTHLASGEPLVGRIATADASSSLDACGGASQQTPTSLRIVGNRQLRGHPHQQAVKLEAAAPRGVNVLAAAHPLIRQLRARLHTTIGLISQTLVDADALLGALSDAVQDLHSTEAVAHSADSAIGSTLANLHAIGISNLAAADDEDNVGLEHISHISNHCPLCAATPEFAQSISAALEVHTAAAASAPRGESLEKGRLLLWWCVQVNWFMVHEGGLCPSRADAWLSQLSDLIAVERFLFGQGGSSTASLLGQLRANFRLYCDTLLAELRAVSAHFMGDAAAAAVEEEEEVRSSAPLPLDAFNAVIVAAVPSRIDSELLLAIHRATFKQEYGFVRETLKSLVDTFVAGLNSELKCAQQAAICEACNQVLQLKMEDSKPKGDCAICGGFTPKRRSTSVAPELLRSLSRLLCSPSDEQPSEKPLASEPIKYTLHISIQLLLERYQDWLDHVCAIVAANPAQVAAFIARQPEGSLDQLPDCLRTVCRQASSATSTTPPGSSTAQARLLLATGLTLQSASSASTITLPPLCADLLRSLIHE